MNSTKISLLLAGLFSATQVWAVPVLQVGAPAAGGSCANGPYVSYQANTSNPTETNTAITSGGTLCVSGLYQAADVVKLGGEYTGPDTSNPSNSLDWDEFMTNGNNATPLFPSQFSGRGAILVVTVPDAYLTGAFSTLTVGGISAFLSDASNSYFPNNHDVTNDSANSYLFFDIGNFLELVAVPNFADATDPANKNGEIKSFALGGFNDLTLGLPWAHFDVMALETTCNNADAAGTACLAQVKSTVVENNPGSHDVTWKKDGGVPPQQVPEPGVLFLMGAGLMGLGLASRRKSA